jgi:protein TonB
MSKTWLGNAVSIVVHALVLAGIFMGQQQFRENPVTVIDFSIVNEAVPEQKKETPAPPRAARKSHPATIASEDAFPDTSRPDTVHPALVATSEPTDTVSKQVQHTGATHRTGVVDSTVLKKEYLTAQYGVIRDKVYRALSYPAYAQEAGWQGTVRMCFFVNRDGSVEKIQILKSSGYQLLDNNAVKAIRQAAPFPYAPVKLQIILPVVYKLE